MDIGRFIGLALIIAASELTDNKQADNTSKIHANDFLLSLEEKAAIPIEYLDCVWQCGDWSCQCDGQELSNIKDQFASAALKRHGNSPGVQALIAQTVEMFDRGEITYQEMERHIQALT